MAAKRKTGGEETEQATQPSFEEALAGLEAIIEAMEHDTLPLETLVDHYEKGAAYLARCEAVLRGARGRIELITLKNQGEIGLDAGAIPDEGDESAAPDDTDDDNDIRLF